MLVLITYDVSTADPKGARRLRRVARVCQNFGQRVQNSVFECQVDPAQLVRLRASLLAEIDPKFDSLRVYFLGQNLAQRVEHFGIKKPYDPQGTLIVE